MMGHLSARYSKYIKEMMRRSDTVHQNREITPSNVFQEANRINREFMREIVGELALPGSGIQGGENIKELARLADSGKRCLLLPAHISNMDVPAFWHLMEKAGSEYADIFERIVFMAGRKLNESSPIVKMFTEMYTRVVITPKSTFEGLDDGPEKQKLAREAQAINLSAHRAVKRLSGEGRIFLVYPSGTRYRPWAPETGRGLREVENYLRLFDYFCVGATKGNLLPPMETDMDTEYPAEDVIVMRFGPVMSTAGFRQACRDEADALTAEGKGPDDIKQFTIDRVMEMIAELTLEIVT